MRMEITMLYVVELENGEKHYFGKEIDRNYYLNRISNYGHFAAKLYEIEL